MTNEKLIQTAKDATRNDTVLQRGIVDLLCQALEASDVQVKQLAAEKAVPALEKLASITCDEIFDAVAFGVDEQVDIASAYSDIASPAAILALLAERDADKKRIAELEQKADIYDMLRTDYELEGSLVDFVDWQAKRIEMLELYTTERDAQNQDLLLNIGSLQQRIAELEARTVSVNPGEVLVTVSGFTGCGKSAIAGEIEIAMRAIGLPVEWTNGNAEKRLTGADWLTAIEMYKPTVRIVEINVPRAGINLEVGE